MAVWNFFQNFIRFGSGTHPLGMSLTEALELYAPLSG